MEKRSKKNFLSLIRAFKKKFGNSPAEHSSQKDTAINILETDKSYKLELALPGFKKENLTMKVDDDILTIKAEPQNYNNKEDEKKSKRSFLSSFKRLLLLPDDIQDDAITASYKDEILHVVLPKSNHPIKGTRNILIQ